MWAKVSNNPSTLTRRGRQKRSFPLANYSTGSVATISLGMWSLFEAAFKCVHLASEVGRGPTWTWFPLPLPLRLRSY